MKHQRIMEYLCAAPWLIEESWLRLMIAIAEGDAEISELLGSLGAPEAAVQVREGEPYDEDGRIVVRDGIAIVPVFGPLTKRATLLSRVSGMTSYETLARDVVRLAEDSAIEGLVFDFDTPGGAVWGVEETGDILYELRGTKPMIAHVGGQASSAGYWLASAMDLIVGTQTAWGGSIGARMVIRDYTKADEKSGIATYDIVSSNAPKKRVDPGTAEGRDQILEILNEVESVFIAAVARNRGISAERVISDYGQGGVLVGRHAVEAGLFDRLGSFESALAVAAERSRAASRRILPAAGGSLSTDIQPEEGEMSQQQSTPATATTNASAAGQEVRVEVRNPDVNLAYLEQHHPGLLAEIRQAAAAAERERIVKIQASALPGQEKLVAQLVAEGASVEAAAVRLLQDVRERRLSVAASMRADEADVDGLEAGASATGAGADEGDPEAKAADFILNAGKAARATA